MWPTSGDEPGPEDVNPPDPLELLVELLTGEEALVNYSQTSNVIVLLFKNNDFAEDFFHALWLIQAKVHGLDVSSDDPF